MQEEFIQKYDDWNIKKQNIHFSPSKQIYFKEGDVWWCSLGLNIGSESYGKGKDFRRPILIVRKLSEDLCIALPVTSKIKNGSWFASFVLNGEYRSIMLCQIRTLNKKRFQRKIGRLHDFDFVMVKEKLEKLLELSKKSSPSISLDRKS